jgi:hypothetical protein
LGSEAGGASVSSSSSSEEAELAGESREKSSIEAGSEGDVMEVGESRFACWSEGCAVLGDLLVFPACVVVGVMEWRVGRFGVDLE